MLDKTRPRGGRNLFRRFHSYGFRYHVGMSTQTNMLGLPGSHYLRTDLQNGFPEGNGIAYAKGFKTLLERCRHSSKFSRRLLPACRLSFLAVSDLLQTAKLLFRREKSLRRARDLFVAERRLSATGKTRLLREKRLLPAAEALFQTKIASRRWQPAIFVRKVRCATARSSFSEQKAQLARGGRVFLPAIASCRRDDAILRRSSSLAGGRPRRSNEERALPAARLEKRRENRIPR